MTRTMPPHTRTVFRQVDSLGGDQTPQPSSSSDSMVIKGRGGRRGRGQGRGRGRGSNRGGGVDFNSSAPTQYKDRMIIDSLTNITVLLTNMVNS